MSGGLWAAVMGGGLAAVYAALALGYSGDLSLAFITVGAGAVLLALERARPERPEWQEADGQWWHDLGHLFAGFAPGTFGGTWLAQWLVDGRSLQAWPAGWPLAAQVVLAMAIAEFCIYWQHRAVHTVPALWPLHALHHGTARMTFFKTTRIHALDIGTATLLWTAPLLLLGAPAVVVLWVTAFGNFAAPAQHANVRMRTPAWLNAVVCTPAVHWLHHSLDKREGNSNFGMNLMLWDHVFGTYLRPGPSPRVELGIEPNHVPPTFAGQLAMPWQGIRALRRRT